MYGQLCGLYYPFPLQNKDSRGKKKSTLLGMLPRAPLPISRGVLKTILRDVLTSVPSMCILLKKFSIIYINWE